MDHDVWLMLIGSAVSAVVAVPVAWAFFVAQKRSSWKDVELILRGLEMGGTVHLVRDEGGRITRGFMMDITSSDTISIRTDEVGFIERRSESVR